MWLIESEQGFYKSSPRGKQGLHLKTVVEARVVVAEMVRSGQILILKIEPTGFLEESDV